MRRTTCLAALSALALALAACGSTTTGQAASDAAASPGDQPGVTTPVTGVPYEIGGADGSGADGLEDTNARGGVAAGSDDSGP